MRPVPIDIKERAIKNFFKADPEFGEGIAKHLGLPSVKSRLWSMHLQILLLHQINKLILYIYTYLYY